jgi:hypothetical protein
MKKIIIIIVVSLFIHQGFSQTKYSVPRPTDIQKFQLAATQLNSSYLIQISCARSLNKEVEETGKFLGDQLASTWNRAGGFDGLVQGVMYIMITLVPYGSVDITDQSRDSVVFLVAGLLPELKEGGTFYGVTYQEYLRFWNSAFSRLSEKFGAEYIQKDTDDGLKVTIRKKPPT